MTRHAWARVCGAACAAALAVLGSEPLRLPPPPGAAPVDGALASLGRELFFDTELSKDRSVACATCHRPEYAFADPRPVPAGVAGARGSRNAPSLINVAYGRRFFWDGRAASLEEQAAGPLTNPREMGLSEAEAVRRVRENPGYAAAFQKLFGPDAPQFGQITRALAEYQRTLAAPTPYHHWLLRRTPLPEAAERGRVLFFGKARCGLCHSGLMLTTGEFLNVGAGQGSGAEDGGRFEVTMRPEDWRLFKVPSLINAARTAPYMHDGSIGTLAEVVEFYDRGGEAAENKDYRVAPLGLSAEEKQDLLKFLEALNTEPHPLPGGGAAASREAARHEH